MTLAQKLPTLLHFAIMFLTEGEPNCSQWWVKIQMISPFQGMALRLSEHLWWVAAMCGWVVRDSPCLIAHQVQTLTWPQKLPLCRPDYDGQQIMLGQQIMAAISAGPVADSRRQSGPHPELIQGSTTNCFHSTTSCCG